MKIFKKLTSAVSAFFIAGSVIALTGNTLKCHAYTKKTRPYRPFKQLYGSGFMPFENFLAIDYERETPNGFISILGGTGLSEGFWPNMTVNDFVQSVFFQENMENEPYPIFSYYQRYGDQPDSDQPDSDHYDDIMEIILQKKSGKFSFYPNTLKRDIITRYYNITGRRPNDFIADPAEYGDNARFINIFREVWKEKYENDPCFKAQINNNWKKQVFDFLEQGGLTRGGEPCNYNDVQKIQLCMCIHDILADLKGEELGLLNRLRWIKPDFKLDDVAPPEGVPALSLVNTMEGQKLQFNFRIRDNAGRMTLNITTYNF